MSRPQQDLSGTWELIFDLFMSGLEEGWQTGHWPANAGSPIQVPGIWNLAFPTMEGVGFYKTSFKYNPEWKGKTVSLHFDGASYFSQAWVNGQYAGSQEGAYTPFSFDISAYIEPDAENILVVRVASLSKTHPVDGRILEESPASKQSWFYTFGGLWGKVYLEALPHVYIEQVSVTPDLQKQHIQVDTGIQNRFPTSQPCKLSLEVISPDGQMVANFDHQTAVPPGTVNHSFTIPIRHPLAWSTQTPNLYHLKVSLIPSEGETDRIETLFGMRDFTVHEGQFLLNGEPLFIRGILQQPDYPKTIVVPPDAIMMEKEMRLAKEAGFNLLRVHIRPAAPGLLNLADEVGMLVYAEASLAWIRNSRRLKEHGKREVSELIRLGYNHPSVVFWGIYNENPRASAINGSELLSHARSLDPTRVIIQDSGGSLAIDQDFGWIDRAYQLPERQVQPEKAIDIHLYLGGVLPKPVYQWLSRLGSNDNPSTCLADHRLGSTPVLEEFDRELKGFRGKIFLSELGCGGITDLDAAVSGYKDSADLQDVSDLRKLRDELQQGFNRRGLDKIFGNVKNLVGQVQELQAAGETSQIEAVLLNPRFSGFSITQLCDVAWECHAGILDVWRNPKPAYHALRRLNQPHCLIVEPGCTVAATGGTVPVSLARVSQEAMPPGANIQFRTENEQGGVLENLSLPAGSQVGVHFYNETRFSFEDPGRYRISVRLNTVDGNLAETSVPVLVLEPDNPDQWMDRMSFVGAHAPIFNNNPPNSRNPTLQDFDLPLLIALPGSLTVGDWEKVLDAVQRGSTAIIGSLTPEDHLVTELLSRLGVSAKLFPGIGSWNGCYHWIPGNRLFKGLPAECIAGEEYIDVLPHYVLGEMGGEVLSGSFTTTSKRGPEKHVLWHSDIESINTGKGKIIFCQYRFFNQKPGHPVAMQLANNLLQMVIENNENIDGSLSKH